MENIRGILLPDIKPLCFSGPVIHGFGRGSKQLGCPTANIPMEKYKDELSAIHNGVYYGYASVAKGPVYSMVMNIGWSPYYGNKEKTIEIHVLHEFPDDFYGDEIRAVAVGYVRQEANFDNVEGLKEAIREDIAFAKRKLKQNTKWKEYKFLQ
jgi:riboflavin kinase